MAWPVKKCNLTVSYVANVCKGHRQDNLPPEFNFDREITYHLHIVYMLVLVDHVGFSTFPASTTLEKMEIWFNALLRRDKKLKNSKSWWGQGVQFTGYVEMKFSQAYNKSKSWLLPWQPHSIPSKSKLDYPSLLANWGGKGFFFLPFCKWLSLRKVVLSNFWNCFNHLVAVVHFHFWLFLDFRTVFVEIKLPILLYYWITYFFIRSNKGWWKVSVFPSSAVHFRTDAANSMTFLQREFLPSNDT